MLDSLFSVWISVDASINMGGGGERQYLDIFTAEEG